MKKLLPLLLTVLLLTVLCLNASAECCGTGASCCAEAADCCQELVYGTATLTYAEFYAGDVSSTEGMDVVTSATTGKSGTFSNTVSDFVDESANKDGYHLIGVANVNVAVPAADVAAYKAINPTFVETEEAPVQYKPVTIEEDQAVYGATVLNVADTVADANIEVITDSRWGDYQINVLETSTQYIRNTRSDKGFAVNSGVQGIIVETASGLKVGMEHLQSIWVQPYEISWNVTVDNTHNDELIYDNLSELDKLMGETLTKVIFINQNDAYVYEFEGAYLPIKFPSSMAAENAAAAAGTTAISVNGLPEDYAPVYTVDGLEIAVAANSTLTWTDNLPGAYTLVLNDANGKYALLSADFVLDTDILPVAFDSGLLELALVEGEDEAMLEAFIKNLSAVTVNGTRYAASGRGAAVIINKIGELDTDAAITSGQGAEAVVTPIFAESGDYTIVAESIGFNTPLEFVAHIEK